MTISECGRVVLLYTLRFLSCFCGLLMCLVTVMPCAAQEPQAISVSSSATAAVLYEPSSGRVLFEQNAHSKYAMASTTKLMTALLAAERLSSDTVLTASAEALAVVGSSMGLKVGDTVMRDDLLRGLLLSSGNDAANVFALTVSDSFEAFAQLMNERAKAIGMTKTQFVTPSGLDADGHGASAYDMALLAAEVLQNDVLAEICALRSATVTVSGREVYLQNHNKLLSMYDGAIGMKTGYTSKAGRCLVSAAKRDGVTLIAVTLNCRNDWEEHMVLLDEGFSCLRSVELGPPALPPIDVFGAVDSSVEVSVPSTQVTVMAGDEEAIVLSVVCPPFLWAPVEAGQVIGRVEYRLRGSLLASVPITVTQSLAEQEEKPWLWQMWHLFYALLHEAVT